MKYSIGLILTLYLTGCSSTPQVKKIDTEVDAVKGSTSQGVLALKDGQAIIQETTQADDELKWQQFKNYDLEREVLDEHYWLKRCREELSDSRLGGTGEVLPLPEVDQMKSPDSIREEFGLSKTNDSLVFVKRQDFLEKLGHERKYQTTLEGMLKTLKPLKAKCEREEGNARVKVGLPAHRYEGTFSLTSEGNISQIIEKRENSLDDAFEILKEKKAPSSQ